LRLAFRKIKSAVRVAWSGMDGSGVERSNAKIEQYKWMCWRREEKSREEKRSSDQGGVERSVGRANNSKNEQE
jgi:hypothetical protein